VNGRILRDVERNIFVLFYPCEDECSYINYKSVKIQFLLHREQSVSMQRTCFMLSREIHYFIERIIQST